MTQNIIEFAREQAVQKLFETNGFNLSWPIWKENIKNSFNQSTPTSQ